MIVLKQSTARNAVFFAHDVNGDGVTGIADGSWTKRISKDGGAFAAMTVTITEMENGWYSFPLSTAHTDTLGFLSISFSSASSKRVNLLFDVRVRLLDDLCFPTVSGRSIDVDATGGVEITAGQSVNAATVGDKTGYSLTGAEEDAIVDKVWDELKGAHTVPDSFGDYLDDEITSRALAGDAMALTAAAIDAIWDEAQAGHVTVGTFGKRLDADVSSRAVPGDAMDLIANAVDAAAIATGAIDADALAAGAITAAKFAVDAIDATVLSASACAEIADKLLGRSIQGGADGGRTVTDALRYLRNRVAISGGTMTVYQENDTTSAWTAAVTTTAGNPITEIDPA